MQEYITGHKNGLLILVLKRNFDHLEKSVLPNKEGILPMLMVTDSDPSNTSSSSVLSSSTISKETITGDSVGGRSSAVKEECL